MDDDGGDELPGFAPKQHERDKFISGAAAAGLVRGRGCQSTLVFYYSIYAVYMYR